MLLKEMMLGAMMVASWLLLMAAMAEGRTFGTTKTCPEGYKLHFNSSSGKSECTCLPYHLYWPLNGLCYRESTQGPCQAGNRLIWNAEIEQAECQCPAFWSRYPKDGQCYEEYSPGPCQKGQLFVDGQCTCNEDMTMHYHLGTKQCFQLYSEGENSPCSGGKIFQFNYHLQKPECVCKDDHIEWTDGNCYEVNTVGPCNSTQCPKVLPVHRTNLFKMYCL